ncbi:MAG: triacylglycerol lipase [Frankiales bacterium]|jgi:pimeloyl-ACP methyl ester carboxylesterase|nr:triacylglycerol lipase [Frankiales bacterium]
MSDLPLAVKQLGSAALRVRGPVAMTRFLRSDVLAGKGVPHGDGRPVLLLPPAAAGDWLMPVMLGWLRRIHYTAYSSQIALHVDCSDRTMSRILPRLEEVAEANDRKVTLVGHSRGGLLSRALMTARPDLVERVVTLASPIHEPFAVTNLTLAKAADLARSRLQRDPARLTMGCLTQACACTYGRFFRKELAPGMPPLIALFTRRDEVVRWQACLEDGARNIEIRGTHLGLLASRNVYTTVAHALTGEYDEPGITWQGKAPSLAELALAI